MTGQEPQQQIRREKGMMDIVCMEDGYVQRRVQSLKNEVLESDLQQHLAPGGSGEAFSGEIACNQHEQRHMETKDP
ncbi:hypothetical protein D3C75_1192780 [compost metagenome]